VAIFLSDIHLGNSRCQAERLIKFRVHQRTLGEQLLYLVGDTIDNMSSRCWPSSHMKVLELLLAFPRVIYLPGNHDSFMRVLLGWGAHNIVVYNSVIHFSDSGKRFLVTHGDVYDPTLFLCMGPAWFRRSVGHGIDGLHTKLVSNQFQRRLVSAAIAANCDGVVCGHIHKPEQTLVGGKEYLNCGDWLDSCTAVIEHNGELMLTFDSNLYGEGGDPLKELVKSNLPDQVEVGETNEYWVFVSRKTKKLELVSKQTGLTVIKCEISDADKWGIHPLQVRVAQDALKL
jgi:UDP-2,3-diacylglucosamine pyrophosphatase LpxH